MARVLYLPGVVLAVSHSVFDPATAYTHHDVYLYPARDGGGGLGVCQTDDKFAYLRSRKMSSKCNLELRILDSLTEPFTINARLDVLHAMCDAIYQAALQKEPKGDKFGYRNDSEESLISDFAPPPPSSPTGRDGRLLPSFPSYPSYPSYPSNPTFPPPVFTPLLAKPYRFHTPTTAPSCGLPTGLKQSKQRKFEDYPPLEIREKSTLTVFSIMRQWDVQISLGRIVTCSWPSKSSLSGECRTVL